MPLSSTPFTATGGDFPFPLTDQASLFNFHTPLGLGMGPRFDSFYPNAAQGMNGCAFDLPAPTPVSADNPSAGAFDLPMDMALLNGMTGNNPLACTAASSLVYSQATLAPSHMTSAIQGISASNHSHLQWPLQSLIGTPHSSQQQQQEQQAAPLNSSPRDTQGQMTAHMRAARTWIFNNVLHNMSIGAIQNLDGVYSGGIAMPLAKMDATTVGVPNYSSVNRFIPDTTMSDTLDVSAIGRPANFADLPLAFSALGAIPQPAYPMVSPISPANHLFATNNNSGSGNGSNSGLNTTKFAVPTLAPASAPAIDSQLSSAAPARVNQACKMCRRRKVRCDGLRPSCGFCQTKKFECIYEPITSGSRKRGRQSMPSEPGSVLSSNSSSKVSGPHTNYGLFHHDTRAGQGDAADYDELGFPKPSKRRRLSEFATASFEGTHVSDQDMLDSDSADELSLSGEGRAGHGYLEALSNRQIALPANVAPAIGLRDITNGCADVGLANTAAALLAGITGAPRGNSDLKYEACAANPDKESAAAVGNDALAGNAPLLLVEQHMRLYFTFFHPQHPVLHRHTFEKAVRKGTVNKVLWHAVQAIAARYGPAPNDLATSTSDSSFLAAEPLKGIQQRLRPYEYGKRYAKLVRVMLPEATRAPTIEIIQALYLLSEHQFGMGDWLEGTTYWGTAVRMLNQLQLHMTDEAFQFPAYTSHLGLHESAISSLTAMQSPANYASEMRKSALNNESWIKRELERRMRWVLFESERMHTLAGGTPPLVTLEAGWVDMPCSDAIWEMSDPRRAGEYERLLLHMGRYYIDAGGSLRVDMAASSSVPSSQPVSRKQSIQASQGKPLDSAAAPAAGETLPEARRRLNVPLASNRAASMLVSVRQRKNRIHLKAHTAIVIGQMTQARLAMFRLFFPCRWPSQLMPNSLFGAGYDDYADLGGGGGAPGPMVLSWDERFQRMRITIADIEAKLMQWRVYLEIMFPLREHEEGSGRTAEENQAIHRERVEYANYRFMLAALLIQNRSTVLQLQATLA
ncbi:hypothetical protein LPJ66_010288, partial [Kickxella alabastrina]